MACCPSVMDSCIGASEAKAQLSRLLGAVSNGEQFTITVRGQPIADLVPHRSQSAHNLKASVHAMRRSQGFNVSPMPTRPAS